MGSSEPSLVPEWLRSNGHGSSGASAANSHSDSSVIGSSARNRLPRTNTESDNPRALLERSSSINSRKSSSSSGSSKHPYSSFSRSHREKELEKEKSGFGNFWERDSCEPLGKDSLRRTRSMASRNQSDSLPGRVASDPKNIEITNNLRNGLVTGDKSAATMPRVSFEKDFPSLGADEKQVPNVVRVASPGLPIGSSASVGEGWSALAEVPVVVESNSSAQSQSIHQPLSTPVVSSINSGDANAVSGASKSVSETSNVLSGAQKSSGALGSSSALNMAEALVQSPSVSRNAPQSSVETQKLEQMAIKKVRQLIPMTPTTPKALNSSDKLKTKLSARVGEMTGATKVAQQLSSSSLNGVGQSTRNGPVTSDASKHSAGSKLYVLKPHWENSSSSSTSEDAAILENGDATIRVANNLHVSTAVSSASAKSTNISKASLLERKTGVSSLCLASSVEKRPLSSAQSRSDFFNSVRKKTPMTTAVTSDTDSFTQSPTEEKPCEMLKEMISTSPRGTENGTSVSNDDSSSEVQPINMEKSLILCAGDTPSEEEAALLHSLGWDEFSEEKELTEEEINGFYQLVRKLRPSLDLSAGVLPFLKDIHK